TRQIHISQPVLSNKDLEKLKNMQKEGFEYAVINSVFKADGKPGRLEESLKRICHEAEEAVHEGKKILIISDSRISEEFAPISSLMATGAVHHYLVEKRIRTKVGHVVEAGDV